MKAWVLAMALAGAGVCAGGQEAQPAQQDEIHAIGCVEKGVEAGCLLLKDAATSKVYQLLVRGSRPEAGMGIEVAGSRFRGVTSCMQGLPVAVRRWSRSEGQQCKGSGGAGK